LVVFAFLLIKFVYVLTIFIPKTKPHDNLHGTTEFLTIAEKEHGIRAGYDTSEFSLSEEINGK